MATLYKSQELHNIIQNAKRGVDKDADVIEALDDFLKKNPRFKKAGVIVEAIQEYLERHKAK